MKTLRDFLVLFKEKIRDCTEAQLLLERLGQQVSLEEFARYLDQEVTMELLLNFRRGISQMFAWRIQGISSEALYHCSHRNHAETIQKFDELAWEQGFKITEKRDCVSFTEAAREDGIIQVTAEGVSLTPKGEQIAEEVRREIEEEL